MMRCESCRRYAPLYFVLGFHVCDSCDLTVLESTP